MLKVYEGMKVRVKPKHPWRANEIGTVIVLHHNDDLAGRFTVLFDRPGVGFDGGSCLILGQEDVDAATIDD